MLMLRLRSKSSNTRKNFQEPGRIMLMPRLRNKNRVCTSFRARKSNIKIAPRDQIHSPDAAVSASRTADVPHTCPPVNKSKHQEHMLLSIVQGAPVELIPRERFFNPKSLPNWLYNKELQSFKSYFQNPATPSNERSWMQEAGVETVSYSKANRKKARAQRTARSFLLINLGIPKILKQLLNSSHVLGNEWSAINVLADSAKLVARRKYVLATDNETIAVLLIRLLTGRNGHTKLKLLDLLATLAKVYESKVLIAKLGGFRILTKAMLLGDTNLDIKRKTIQLLSSLCEAKENIGCFLKDAVGEAVLQELGRHGAQLIEEFSVLASAVRSPIILGRFINSIHILQEGPRASEVHHTAISLIQIELDGLSDESLYGTSTGWDW